MLLREEARARGLRVLERDSRSHSGVDGGSEYCERHVARTRVSAVASARTRVWRCPCRSGRPMWCARARRASCDTWQRARHDSDATLGVRALRTWHLRRAGVCTEILDRSAALHSPRTARSPGRPDSAAFFIRFFPIVSHRDRGAGAFLTSTPLSASCRRSKERLRVARLAPILACRSPG